MLERNNAVVFFHPLPPSTGTYSPRNRNLPLPRYFMEYREAQPGMLKKTASRYSQSRDLGVTRFLRFEGLIIPDSTTSVDRGKFLAGCHVANIPILLSAFPFPSLPLSLSLPFPFEPRAPKNRKKTFYFFRLFFYSTLLHSIQKKKKNFRYPFAFQHSLVSDSLYTHTYTLPTFCPSAFLAAIPTPPRQRRNNITKAEVSGSKSVL